MNRCHALFHRAARFGLRLLPALFALSGLAAPAAAVDMPLDERLTMPRNYIAADHGVFANSQFGGATPIDVISFYHIPGVTEPNRFLYCIPGTPSSKTWHVQQVVRLPNKDGRAYFMVAQSWRRGGWISLLQTGPDGYDPETELVRNQPGGKYIWQDLYVSGNPIGSWNHPGKMEVIGGLLLVAAQDWTSSTMVQCNPPGTILGGSEDAVLFYDVRNPERPKYLGKITASQLNLAETWYVTANPALGKTRWVDSVSLFRSALDEWFLSAGGGDSDVGYSFSTRVAKTGSNSPRVSPGIGDWTPAGAGAITGQYGMNFNSFEGSVPPPNASPQAIRDWQVANDRQFVFQNKPADDAFTLYEAVYSPQRIPDRSAEKSYPLYQGGDEWHYEDSSLYVTRKGMPIVYAFHNEDTADGRIYQMHHPVNQTLRTPHPDQVVINCNDNGYGSLRRAIGYGGNITFDLQCNKINLTSGPLVVYLYDVDIDARTVPGGLTISAGGKSGVFEITAGNVVTLRSLTIADGFAAGDAFERGTGGGILNKGDLRLIGSTVRDNTAAVWGGGLDNDGTALLINSTIANNKSGFSNLGAAGILSAGALRLVHTTVSGNRGGNNYPGAGIWGFDTPVILENSIVAGNTTTSGQPSDLNSPHTTVGANIVQSSTPNRRISGPAPLTSDPLLEPLADNGGPAWTMRLRAGSPAIDAAIGSSTPIDGRIALRPKGAAADLGAYETQIGAVAPAPGETNVGLRPTFSWTAALGATYEVCVSRQDAPAGTPACGVLRVETLNNSFTSPVLLPGTVYVWQLNITQSGITYLGERGTFTTRFSPIVTTLGDENDAILGLGAGNSLREVIAAVAPGETITFAPGLDGGVIALASRIVIDKSVTIDASKLAYGIRINGGSNFGAFAISGTGAVVLNNLTVANGTAIAGGGISVTGTPVTMQNVTMTGNRARDFGGGLYVTGGGSVNLLDSTVSGNVASEGGGIYITGGGKVTTAHAAIAGNTANEGAGVNLQGAGGGTLTIVDSQVKDNNADLRGGGVFMLGGTTRVEGSIVSGNAAKGTSTREGGAIHNTGGSLTLLNTTVTLNTAADGAGIFHDSTSAGSLAVHGSTFTQNTATARGGALMLTGSSSQIPGAPAVIDAATTIARNAANLGGGIYTIAGGLGLTDVTLTGNTARDGGGIYRQGGGAGTLTVEFSTLTANGTTFKGAGIYISGGTARVENSTIAGNNGGASGGIGLAAGANLTVRHATIAGNVGPGIVNTASVLALDNSIVANNFNSLNSPTDVQGDFTAVGANLVRVRTGTLLSGPAPLTADPLLDALAGGSKATQVMAPRIGSPAINAGVASAVTPATDQTHAPRVSGPAPDLGAVERQFSGDATLTSLTTDAGALDPAFGPAVGTYALTVASTTATAAVRPTYAAGAVARVRINGGTYVIVASGAASAPLALKPGDNAIEVQVTAADGISVKVYSLGVARGAPSVKNAALASLSTDAGALLPVFSSAVLAYDLTVANSTNSTAVSAVPADPLATLAVRIGFAAFAPVASGASSGTLPLVVGANTIEVKITAKDGVTTAVYKLVVYREPPAAGNANLASLSSNAGSLSPAFSGGVALYAMNVSAQTGTALIVATPVQPQALVSIRTNGGGFTPIGAGVVVPVGEGVNTIEVRVAAQDGTVKSYTIVLTRNANGIDWPSKPRLAPVPGDGGAAIRPAISANGRFVAFSTKAKNLVAGDTNGVEDVYVVDRLSPTFAIERVSVSDAGVEGNAASTRPSISASGRYVAFQSRASNLVPGDTNRNGSDVSTGEDVFVYDRTTKKIERVSVDNSGGQADGSSFAPSISGDGRFVTFHSAATNLVPGFAGGDINVYIRDRTPPAGTAAITAIAVPLGNFGAGRQSQNPAIATDGNTVAFEFAVAKVADNTPAFSYRDIYAYNRVSGAVKRITGSIDGVAADGNSSAAPSISADGRMIAFHSNVRTLDFFDTNAATDVFVHDQATGATKLASIDATGTVQCQTGTCSALNAAITGDGRRVAFLSAAPNLVTPATNGKQHVFIKDLTSGQLSVLSRDATGTDGDGDSGFPSASFDGRAMAFDSLATNLSPGDANQASDIFVSAAPEVVLSHLADLATLTTSAGALTPGFSSSVISYAATVPETSTTVQVRANPADGAATMELRSNGGAFSTLAGDASSAPMPLTQGLNIVEVRVTAQDGTTAKTYSLNVTRALSVDATLASLVPVADFQPALSPAFTAGTTAYTLAVPNETASIRFTPTVAQSKATVKVSGVAVTSGATSGALALALGANTITVAVTAQNGSTVRNYVVTVTRAAALVAAAIPATTVVEYINVLDFPNSPGGHFFYSTDPAEQAAVDSGAAGRFNRTGRQFYTGGTAQVCRFYGSVAPGPNSHFFTVDAGECNALKAAQIKPTPASVQQWNSEGFSYNTTPATIAADGTRSCPANTLPLYRAYNNAFPLSGPKNPWDSNHRFTPELADIAAMVAGGWRDEGIVFCTAP